MTSMLYIPPEVRPGAREDTSDARPQQQQQQLASERRERVVFAPLPPLSAKAPAAAMSNMHRPVSVKQALISTRLSSCMCPPRSPHFNVDGNIPKSSEQTSAFTSQTDCTHVAHAREH